MVQHDSEGFCFWYGENDDAYLAGYHRKNIVICNDLNIKSAQLEKANALDLSIMCEEEFMNKYELDVLYYENA